ncbi:phage tail protein [Desulfuromonas thiophila]|uniref:phage tail protein n=1 Tax=Desulfuromonas thiophila TaxID=57664 RepID=UPI0029F53BA1|nr:phage tail protein [Desulfuromonas thiophila]
MKNHLLLGPVGLARLSAPLDFTEKKAVSYAAHDIVEGKTLLQYTGAPCDEMQLRCAFHAEFCRPQQVWDSLQALLSSRQAFTVLTGAGALLGSYALESLDKTTTLAAEDGTLYAFEVTLSLREYVTGNAVAAATAAQQASAPGLSGNASANVRRGP